MVEGKTYRIVLRRWSTKDKPEIVVHDAKTSKVLATLPWRERQREGRHVRHHSVKRVGFWRWWIASER
jgi:hypothetical protein